MMIDKTATLNKVAELLKGYHSIRRMAGFPYFHSLEKVFEYQSQINVEFEEKECSINRKNDYHTLIKDIHEALLLLFEEEAKLLFDVYMNRHDLSDMDLYHSMKISKDTFYRHRNKASIHFSESFRGGSLIVFKDEDN